MPAKRKYDIKTSKDFLVLTGICFFLCLWAVKDAWYPSDKVEKKHPRIVEVSFDIGGAVAKVHVGVGDSVGEGRLLAELRRTQIEVDFEATKKEYTATKSKHVLVQQSLSDAEHAGMADDGLTEIKDSVAQAKTAMVAVLKKLGEIRATMNSTKLLSPTKGEITKVFISSHSQIEAGKTALAIDPKDHFYLFNKSLAILSFIAFWVFLALHILIH